MTAAVDVDVAAVEGVEDDEESRRGRIRGEGELVG
jgi:hypothetical protein